MTGYLSPLLRYLGVLSLLISSACTPPSLTGTPPPLTPTQAGTPTPTQVVRVHPAKIYSRGNVISANRLEIDWFRNLECARLNEKYDRTTGDVVVDNIKNVLRNYPRNDVLGEGFEMFSKLSMSPEGAYARGGRQIFVRESTEDNTTLLKIGQEVYEHACDDPENKPLFR